MLDTIVTIHNHCFLNSTYWLVLPIETHCTLSGKVKVKFTLEQATKVQRGIRSIALLFL